MALALAVALVAVACNDGAADPTPAATPPAPATPAATEVVATPEPTPSPIELTDSGGFAFVLEGPAQRIISHSPGATEILFAIGAGPQVVAVDQFSYYPPETADLPQVSYSSPDPEQGLAHEPDLVIFATRQEGSIEQFRSLGLPVFFIREPSDLAGVMENIRTIGMLTGHLEAAEALIADMEARLAAVAERLADVDEGPRVYYEVTDSYYTVAPQSFIGGALSLVKARNIAEGATTPFPQLTSEAIVDANPDVILMANAEFVPVDSVPDRPGWSAITAVAEGRIYPVDGDIMSRPGPRIVDGVEMLARLFYPERFE
jgi:iron complex transport system substrate-binding protein